MAPSNSVFRLHPASFRHLSCRTPTPPPRLAPRRRFAGPVRHGVVVAWCGGERNRPDRDLIRIFARIVTFYASR